MRIAIIGDNNLSKAVNFGFPSNYCVKYNIDENAIETLPNYINYAFICIENIDRISDVITRLKTAINGHIILKSSILPENLTNLIKISSSIIYNSEFLNPNVTELEPNIFMVIALISLFAFFGSSNPSEESVSISTEYIL